MRQSIIFLLATLFLFSCRREIEEIIPGNEAPPDATISTVVLESYVNRAYIVLVGEKPDEVQLNASIQILRTNNVSQSDRENFLDGIMQGPDYYQRLFDVGRGLYINGADTTAINDEIAFLNLLLNDNNYASVHPLLLAEKQKLQAVLAIPSDLVAGSIDVTEMQKRLIFNRMYDMLNMGTQNFVISMFQNFFNRYPTEAERQASELMVDGFSSQVLFETGRNKSDFVDIVFRSSDYYEGQVRQVFIRNLFREPSSEELENYTLTINGNKYYKALQKAVLSMDEFIGI